MSTWNDTPKWRRERRTGPGPFAPKKARKGCGVFALAPLIAVTVTLSVYGAGRLLTEVL